MNKTENQEKFEDMYYGTLGMCGCGDAESVKNFVYKMMEFQKRYHSKEDVSTIFKERKEYLKNLDPDTIVEFVGHILESIGFYEHGSSVYGSWFTKEGEEFFTLLEEFKDKDLTL